MRPLALFVTFALLPALCQAQAPAVLGKCIVANLSASDRQDLARWVFLSMAVHPEVKQFSVEDPEPAQAAARKVGALFTRILRDRCAKEINEAARSGGRPVVQSAIDFFVQIGVQELLISKDVLAALGSFSQFADKEGIERSDRAK